MFLRISAVLALSSLLTGCYLYGAPENIENLKGDIKLLKAHLRTPPSSVCGAPGSDQNVLCNYRLIVKKVRGEDLYQGIVDPTEVEKGYNACMKFTQELKQKKDAEWVLRDYECVKAEDYNNTVYLFKIDGDAQEGIAADYHSVPGSRALRKGKLEPLFMATQH
jgi:hypothetical protein